MLGIGAWGIVIQCIRIIILDTRGDRCSGMLLHKSMNKVPTNGVGTLEKAKSLVSHKLTSELWTHINAGGNIMFLLCESMDRVTSELVAFRELEVRISRDNN